MKNFINYLNEQKLQNKTFTDYLTKELDTIQKILKNIYKKTEINDYFGGNNKNEDLFKKEILIAVEAVNKSLLFIHQED